MAMSEWKLCRTAIWQTGIKVLLCDDDREFLNAFCDEIVEVFTKLNLKAELSAFNKADTIPEDMLASCEIAFFDIDFDGENYNGIDVARRLRAVNKKAILFFATNFIDYAPAGYEVQAFRYILKRDRSIVLERYVMQAIEQIADEREFLSISDGEQSIDFLLDDILYMDVLGHEVVIHRNECTHTLTTSLSSLEEQLQKCGFLRIHNSYLVNMRYIQKYRSRECILTDGTVLPTSERNYSVQSKNICCGRDSDNAVFVYSDFCGAAGLLSFPAFQVLRKIKKERDGEYMHPFDCLVCDHGLRIFRFSRYI